MNEITAPVSILSNHFLDIKFHNINIDTDVLLTYTRCDYIYTCYLVTSSVLSCCHGCHVAHCLVMRDNYPEPRTRAPHRTCAAQMWNRLMPLSPLSLLWFSLYIRPDNVCFYEVPGLRQIAWHAVLSPPLLLRARGNVARIARMTRAPSRARGGSWAGAVRGLYLRDNQMTRLSWPDPASSDKQSATQSHLCCLWSM